MMPMESLFSEKIKKVPGQRLLREIWLPRVDRLKINLNVAKSVSKLIK